MFTILIPTDYSAGSANAIRYALRLTAGFPCRYVFFHANITPVGVYTSLNVAVLPDPPAIAKKLLEGYVRKILRSGNIKINDDYIRFLNAEGYSAGKEINEAGRKIEADLIIMGSRAAKGLNKIAFGSTATDVIANATMPVLAVPESYRFKPILKIIAASELENIKAELKVILTWARLFKATVELIHFTDATLKDAELIKMAKKVISRADYKKLNLVVAPIYSGNTLVHDILKTIRRQKGDMILMFRHPHNLLGRMFFTSTTENMAYVLPVPMLSLGKVL